VHDASIGGGIGGGGGTARLPSPEGVPPPPRDSPAPDDDDDDDDDDEGVSPHVLTARAALNVLEGSYTSRAADAADIGGHGILSAAPEPEVEAETLAPTPVMTAEQEAARRAKRRLFLQQEIDPASPVFVASQIRREWQSAGTPTLTPSLTQPERPVGAARGAGGASASGVDGAGSQQQRRQQPGEAAATGAAINSTAGAPRLSPAPGGEASPMAADSSSRPSSPQRWDAASDNASGMPRPEAAHLPEAGAGADINISWVEEGSPLAAEVRLAQAHATEATDEALAQLQQAEARSEALSAQLQQTERRLTAVLDEGDAAAQQQQQQQQQQAMAMALFQDALAGKMGARAEHKLARRRLRQLLSLWRGLVYQRQRRARLRLEEGFTALEGSVRQFEVSARAEPWATY
jgi:hypothetical protein